VREKAEGLRRRRHYAFINSTVAFKVDDLPARPSLFSDCKKSADI